MRKHLTLICSLAAIFAASTLSAQERTVAVSKYGSEPIRVASVEDWENVHRPVIMNFFEQQVYGLMPDRQVPVTYEVLSEQAGVLGGKAIRKEVAMRLEGMDSPILILMYLPANAQGPVPAFPHLTVTDNRPVDTVPDHTGISAGNSADVSRCSK